MLVMTLTTLAALAAAEPADSSSGLLVGKVTITRRDIFSQQELDGTGGPLRLLQGGMNALHIKTREYVLRRELLFHSGDPFRPELLAETERNLRELGYLNNIRVTATDTTADGRVNILVSTRDSWSLQANAAYARASGGDTRWTLQLSDNNFMGHGLTLGAGVGSDEDAGYWNAWFRKRRLTPMHLLVGFDYAQRDDGHYRNVFVSKPFYAQDDDWRFDAAAWDGRNDLRYYLSNAGPAGRDAACQASLYAKLPTHEKGLRLQFQRRISPRGHGRIWRLGAGLRVVDLAVGLGDRPYWAISDGSIHDLRFLLGPEGALDRERGTTVYPHLWLRSQGREWTKARFVQQYGPVEDIPLGLILDVRAGPRENFRSVVFSPEGAAKAMQGPEGASGLFEFSAGRWFKLGPWLGQVDGWGIWQPAENSGYSYHLLGVTTGWIGRFGPEKEPWITRVFAEYAGGRNLLGSQALVLGLGRGLRTLEFDGMAGDRLVRWNVEQGRAAPWEVLGLFRMGAAVFYNGGCAWFTDEDRSLADARHEMGLGLRIGPTRSASAHVSRLDVSWDLQGSGTPVFTATTRGFF